MVVGTFLIILTMAMATLGLYMEMVSIEIWLLIMAVVGAGFRLESIVTEAAKKIKLRVGGVVVSHATEADLGAAVEQVLADIGRKYGS